MGASNSRPVTSKFTDGEENDIIKRAAILDLDGSTSFFGVCDGHGGTDVAMYCARQFHTELAKEADHHNNLANAMERVRLRIDEQLQQSDEWRELANPRGNGNWIQCLKTDVCANLWPSTEATPYIGPQHEVSTACVVLIRHNQIIVGNVGDSRFVLSWNRQAIDLSTDHKPNLQPERRRIRRAGGQVCRDRFVQVLVGQVVRQQWGIYRVQGMLALSRAIGDFALKQNKTLPPAEQMVTCNPDIRTVDITDDTEFLVIASDGIRNCMSSQVLVDFICQHSIYVEIGVKKYAKEGVGGERRAANSNSEWNEYEDISSPSSESDNKSKDPDYDPMEVDEVGNTRGGAESGDSSGNGSNDNNNSSDGGKDDEDEEEGEEEEEEEEGEEQDDGDVDYEEEEEKTPESQKYWISDTYELNALNHDHHILEINPLLPLMDKVSILREGRRRGFYFIRDIAYDQADNYIKRHGIEDDSSDDD